MARWWRRDDCRHGLTRVCLDLKFQGRAQSENRGIAQCPSRQRTSRSRRAATGMDDVLKVRLNGPAVLDLALIDGREQPLEASHRPARIDEPGIVGVARLGPF